MSTTVWLHNSGRHAEPLPGAEGVHHWWEIRTSGPAQQEDVAAAAGGVPSPPTLPTFAFLERDLSSGGIDGYRAARKQGARSFLLWADAQRQRLLARVVTTSATKGSGAVFEVLGGSGESLALITHQRAMSNGQGRARWTVQQANGQTAVGIKGRLFWWYVWWLLFPLWVAIAVGSVVAGSGDIARMPRSIRWRAAGKEVLNWTDCGTDFALTTLGDGWDPRVTAALTALVNSHEGWLGKPWDDGR
ncbi:hypothetical protein AB0C96_39215 [Streptomyces sp. NPDC048506]|uniref:hypothetical protein n=1 Tax=Streptomyces sp. NPDC048506 TaxID=3155028 RepID=UPI00343EEDE2